jgi:hypothetical protein
MARVHHGRPPREAPRPRAAALVATLVLLAAGCAPAPSDAGTATGALMTDETQDTIADTAEPSGSETLLGTETDEHSEVGVLVTGFPVDLIPVPADAMILVTSAVPVGDSEVQEVSLNLRTQLPVDQLMSLYRAALTGAGFTEIEPVNDPADLTAESTFTRSGGDELVSIGILEVDGLRTVTIGGRVHKEKE